MPDQTKEDLLKIRLKEIAKTLQNLLTEIKNLDDET